MPDSINPVFGRAELARQYGVSRNATGVPPTTGWIHTVMKSYVQDLNLEGGTIRVQLVREEGTPTADRTINHIVDATSPWSLHHEFWITPYGFLKGAMTHNEPRVRTVRRVHFIWGRRFRHEAVQEMTSTRLLKEDHKK